MIIVAMYDTFVGKFGGFRLFVGQNRHYEYFRLGSLEIIMDVFYCHWLSIYQENNWHMNQ